MLNCMCDLFLVYFPHVQTLLLSFGSMHGPRDLGRPLSEVNQHMHVLEERTDAWGGLSRRNNPDKVCSLVFMPKEGRQCMDKEMAVG